MKIKLSDKSKYGFTLVELLVVIAIIGILSTATVVSLRVAKQKAKDARRFTDIIQVQKAIEIYYAEYGRYPNSECWGLPAAAGCASSTLQRDWITDLVDITLPLDPINNETFYYLFTHQTDNRGDYYYLVFKLEAQEQVNRCNWPALVGWSCIGGGKLP